MDDEEIDVCETLLDLVDRVVFLSGDDASSSRKFTQFNEYDYENVSFLQQKFIQFVISGLHTENRDSRF